MSFEVVYSYYAKIENSFDYDRENSHIFKKVYGKVEEDYSLESPSRQDRPNFFF